MINPHDIFSVQQLIARFANSFDRKEWEALGSCLAANLYTDYSDLRGTPPATMTREQFVESRRSALQALKTHHLAGNIEIELAADSGEAKVSMLIYRRNELGEILNTHCLYTLGVERTDNGWVIGSIVQKVFWSDGQAAIHRGIIKKTV